MNRAGLITLEQVRGAGAFGHGMRFVGGCRGAREGLRRNVTARTIALSRLDVAVRTGMAFPAPLAADMRTGPLAARWFSTWNGYGAAQHVS